MSRLEMYDYRSDPFKCNLTSVADSSYKGYFHYHQGMEFLYIHQGQGTVTLDRQVYPLEPGTLFVFQPYQLHHVFARVSAETTYIRSVMHFDPIAIQSYLAPFAHLNHFLQYLWKGELRTQVFQSIRDRHPIEVSLRYASASIIGKSDSDDETYATLLIQIIQFIYNESQLHAIALEPYSSRTLTHSENILQWVELHYPEPFLLERVADELHLSKYHISHLFKTETGRSISEYLMARRIKEACRLLAGTNLSVAEIGSRVGWPIASHFTQQFKRWVGKTPLQYRNHQKS